MIAKLFLTGRSRRFEGIWGAAVLAAGAFIALAVVYGNIAAVPDRLLVGILFICSIFTLLFLCVGASPRSPARPTPTDFLLSASSAGVGIYFLVTSDDISARISLLTPFTTAQLVFGSLLMLLTLEATRRTTGLGLTLIVLGFLAYNLFGHHLPPPFGHGLIDYSHLLDILVFTTDGIFGVPIQVVASYVFLFVMFGTLLSRLGGGEFFYQLASSLTGKQVGGPAKIAVISSGLYGTISGSPTSDVATTGSITIPMMKRLGYSPRFAAAVEVAASTGGSAMPPVMGSAAFILAEYTSIPLRDVLIAALIPALVYYVGVFSQVHLRAFRDKLRPDEGARLSAIDVLKRDWPLLIPIAILTGALLKGYSPTMVAVVGSASLIVTSAIFRPRHTSVRTIFNALGETTLRILVVAGACAAAGLVIGGLSLTGLGMKAANIIALAGHEIPIFILLLTAFVTIVLGLGMPTPSAYILAAVLAGPALTGTGLPVMGSHMFILFFAIMSALTPPIAVAAYAAGAIAEYDPMKIAVSAVRLAAVGFLVPFAFIWNPAILAQGEVAAIALAFAGGLCAAVWIAILIEGLGFERISTLTRVAALVLVPLCVAPVWFVALPAIVVSVAAFTRLRHEGLF
ncbi:MAG TPA: TRAP transporter fused permease subunit [Azoarcus taiwanensis]|nr:TRAP transporter fused permease subunit [Azoarcus taiwanensis]